MTIDNLITTVETYLETVEVEAKAAIIVVWQTVKPLLTTVPAEEASIIIQVLKDKLIAPTEDWTAVLADLANRELTAWSTLEPQIQTALLNGLAAAVGLFVTPAKTDEQAS